MKKTDFITEKDWLPLQNIACKLEQADAFPLSWRYNGKRCEGLPASARMTKKTLEKGMTELVWQAEVDQTLSLRVKCIIYNDYPAVEWTAYFENHGTAPSAILEDVQAINLEIPGANARLVHCNGDFASKNGYLQQTTLMSDGEVFTQAPNGGRASDGAFPYQRLLYEDHGFCLAIGWPGQWACRHEGRANGVLLTAGQQTLHTVILPGECLRTPRIALLSFDGSEERGINLWRRWFRDHIQPTQNGKPLQPRLVSSDNGGGIEFTKANEQNQVEGIETIHREFPDISLWWIDAGWYPSTEQKPDENYIIWWRVKDWKPDPERFPNGLKPVGDACKKAGMELLLWFEPERVFKDFGAGAHHPEWVLHQKAPSETGMLNLGLPACRQWLSETISSLLKESGVSCYRQDFNYAPLAYWRDNEEENRQGMVENQYIQGYLAYWDYLRENVPGLWIDSCASGGRRNDLETMSRAVPLHPTDYGYGYHHINQAFRRTLCGWIPYTRSWSNSWDVNNVYYSHEDYYAEERVYEDHFKLYNGLGVMSFLTTPPEMKILPEMIPFFHLISDIWKRFAPLMLNGDYYPLTEDHRDFTKWTVFQFHRPEDGEGAIQALRNNQSKEESLTVYLHGLNAEAVYTLENLESGETLTRSGAQLMQEGFCLTQPVRSGAVWFYRECAE